MITIDDIMNSSWQKRANYESEYQLLVLYLEDYTKLFWRQMGNAIRLLSEKKPKERLEWAKSFNNGKEPSKKFIKFARSTKINDIRLHFSDENIYHKIKENNLNNENYWEMYCLAQEQLWNFINNSLNAEIKGTS